MAFKASQAGGSEAGYCFNTLLIGGLDSVVAAVAAKTYPKSKLHYVVFL
jgi:hypothetical protein